MWIILIILLLVLAIVVCYLMKPVVSGGGEKNREYEYAFMFEPVEEAATKADELREKLKSLGAKRRAEVLMPIAVYNHLQYEPDDKSGPYIRVRHEGDRVTFTVKSDLDSKFVKEYEVNVDKPGGNTVDEMHKMLTALKFPLKYRVEKLREIWNMDEAEIVFDTYPGLPIYIEIETDSKKKLDAVTRKLGFDPKMALTKERDMYSRVYGFPKDRKPPPNAQLIFSEDAKKQFEGLFEKNEELFDKLLKEQIEYIKKL